MRKHAVKRWISMVMFWTIILGTLGFVRVEALPDSIPFSMQSKSAILMDAQTGTVVLQKAKSDKMPIASVTKLMTLLLAFEAMDSGNVKITDMVQISRLAAGMGGSQVFLEAGLSYSVSDLLRSIILASGNDAAVAIAELLAGTEEAFVARMNQRAKEMGLYNTHFTNATGLPSNDSQYSCAMDVAVLARQVSKHPLMFKWSRVWMDTLKHPTGRITQLTNTNRLIRFSDGADGLKTGFTDAAKYCLAATAKRGEQRYIAVVLGAPSSDIRFAEAQKLLDYGFAQYHSPLLAQKGQSFGMIKVKGGVTAQVEAVIQDHFSFLMRRGDEKRIKMDILLPEKILAPVAKNQIIGELVVKMDGKIIGSQKIVAKQSVAKATLGDVFVKILKNMVKAESDWPTQTMQYSSPPSKP